MKKKDKKKLISTVVTLILVLVSFFYKLIIDPAEDTTPTMTTIVTTISSTNENRVGVTFVRHVDGDTSRFSLDGKDFTVRYLCIDTEETVHPNQDATPMGKTASEYVENRLKEAGKIEIEYDGTRTDKYDRVLAWVWVDDVLLNLELVELGYAKVEYVYEDYRYVEELYDAESLAKEAGLGVWAGNIDAGK